MQEHQQWLGNRNYQHHLQCLTKIKETSCRNFLKSAIHAQVGKFSNRHASEDDRKFCNESHQHSNSPRSKKPLHISQKQKQLVYNNFLLGKRIIQANPVINTKKHENQYKKHLKMMEGRVQKSRKLALITQFRQSKLKQFTENTHRFSNFLRLPLNGKVKNILILKILRLQFTKPYGNIEDIIVKMKLTNKKSVQMSQIIHIEILPVYEFYFKYSIPKDPFTISNILIQLYEVKGLEQRHIGGFTIERQNIGCLKTCLNSEFKKLGKEIGQISYEVQVTNKNVLKEQM